MIQKINRAAIIAILVFIISGGVYCFNMDPPAMGFIRGFEGQTWLEFFMVAGFYLMVFFGGLIMNRATEKAHFKNMVTGLLLFMLGVFGLMYAMFIKAYAL